MVVRLNSFVLRNKRDETDLRDEERLPGVMGNRKVTRNNSIVAILVASNVNTNPFVWSLRKDTFRAFGQTYV